MEVYLYCYGRVKHEHDDPLRAFLFHYPQELTSQQVLLRAGQIVATFQATQQFFRLVNQDQSSNGNLNQNGSMRTDRGHCEVVPMGRTFLLIIFARDIAKMRYKIKPRVQNMPMVTRSDLCRIATEQEDEDDVFHESAAECAAKSLRDDLVRCLKLLCGPLELDKGGKVVDDKLRLTLTAYFQMQRIKRDKMLEVKHMNMVSTCQQLFQQLAQWSNLVVVGWISKYNRRIYVHNALPEEVLDWLSLASCAPANPEHVHHHQQEQSFYVKHPPNKHLGVEMYPVHYEEKTWTFLLNLLSQMSLGQSPDCKSMIGDKLRNLLIQDEEYLTTNQPSNQKCFTLYVQKSSNLQLNLVMAKCLYELNNQLGENLWTISLTKMAEIESQVSVF